MTTSVRKDYASSAAAFVRHMGEFLPTAGWSLVSTISGSATYYDMVFSAVNYPATSSGTTVSGQYCIRLRGTGSYIDLYGYDDCWIGPSGDTVYSGEIHNNIYSRTYVPPTECKYWAIADDTHLKFVLKELTSTKLYHGYIGLIDTVYFGEYDTVPLLVFGTSDDDRYWEDGVSPVMNTNSSGVDSYSAYLPCSIDYCVSSRAGIVGGIRPILCYSGIELEKEVRGYPKGVFKIPEVFGGYGSEILTTSGIFYSFVRCGNTSNAYMYG